MKPKKLLILAGILATSAMVLLSVEPSALTFSASASGTANTADTRAVRFVVNRDNAARAIAGSALLATNNAAAYRASYLAILSERMAAIHADAIARSVDQDALLSQLGSATEEAIRAAIASNILNGQTPAQILQRLQ